MLTDGLKTFLAVKNTGSFKRMHSEIDTWKVNNPSKTPIVIFDMKRLFDTMTIPRNEAVCGYSVLENLAEIEGSIFHVHEMGVKLIFYYEVEVDREALLESVDYYDARFAETVKTYDDLDDKELMMDILNDIRLFRLPQPLLYPILATTARFGTVHFGNSTTGPLELARFASDHDVIAIVSDQTDFLLYKGSSKLWTGVDFRRMEELCTELDRNCLKTVFDLEPNQLPYLAALLSGEKKDVEKIMDRYTEIIEVIEAKNLAKKQLAAKGIRELAGPVANVKASDLRTLNNIIESFNLNYTREEPVPLLEKLTQKLVQCFHHQGMSKAHILHSPYYDFRGRPEQLKLTELLIDMFKRRVGVFYSREKTSTDTFDLLCKESFEKKYEVKQLRPIFPTFEVPTFEQLYFSKGKFVEATRWRIFQWITSIPRKKIDRFRRIGKGFRLIVCTLIWLVQNDIFSIREADCALMTEEKMRAGEMALEQFLVPPKRVTVQGVRAVHIYNNTLVQMRQVFASSGLHSHIEEADSMLNGYYFQNMMNCSDFDETRGYFAHTAGETKHRIFAS